MYNSLPMATTAHEQMKKYWDKNQAMGRPMSPWLAYKWVQLFIRLITPNNYNSLE